MLKFGPRKYIPCYVSKVKLGKSKSMVLPPHQIYSFSTFFIRDISETVKLLMEFVIIMRTFQNNANYIWDRPLAFLFALISIPISHLFTEGKSAPVLSSLSKLFLLRA